MADNDIKSTEGTENGLSRREFVSGVGGIGLGAILGGLVVKGFILPEEVFAVPTSQGYLLVDTKKCAGCDTCMVSCSLVHTGRVNPSLSRIQITKNPFGGFPNDMEQIQCRQCPYPACVEVCPTGANHVEEKFGNVRMVDEAKCIGCERCVQACPFTPSRMQWNFEDKHAQKCDLCANTPFWDKDGGPTGKQACVESCPMRAISFTTEVPTQSEIGYMANLRNEHWGVLMLDTTELGREADWAPPGA